MQQGAGAMLDAAGAGGQQSSQGQWLSGGDAEGVAGSGSGSAGNGGQGDDDDDAPAPLGALPAVHGGAGRSSRAGGRHAGRSVGTSAGGAGSQRLSRSNVLYGGPKFAEVEGPNVYQWQQQQQQMQQ